MEERKLYTVYELKVLNNQLGFQTLFLDNWKQDTM